MVTAIKIRGPNIEDFQNKRYTSEDGSIVKHEFNDDFDDYYRCSSTIKI